jgi:hypothetical protein
MKANLPFLEGQDLLRLLAAYMDFYQWIEGEDLFVKVASAVNVSFSTNATLTGNGIFPPTGEEWDLIGALVIATTNKDAADVIFLNIIDNNITGSQPYPLDKGTLQSVNIGTTAGVILRWWPTTNASATQSPNLSPTPRLRQSTNIKRGVDISIATTSTAGTRIFDAYLFIRRRPI